MSKYLKCYVSDIPGLACYLAGAMGTTGVEQKITSTQRMADALSWYKVALH